jgi:hypothetical protein
VIEPAIGSGCFLLEQLDFAFDNFLQCNVCHAHAGTGSNQRRTTAVQLTDTLGDQVDQHQWVGDNFRGLIEEIAFHRRAGKSRNWRLLLKRNDVFGEQGRFFFAQNKEVGQIFRSLTPGRWSNQRLSPLTSVIWLWVREICRSPAFISFGHQVDSKPAENDDRDPEQGDGDGAVGKQRSPKSPTVPQHPRQNQKHRQSGQDKPEGALGVIG